MAEGREKVKEYFTRGWRKPAAPGRAAGKARDAGDKTGNGVSAPGDPQMAARPVQTCPAIRALRSVRRRWDLALWDRTRAPAGRYAKPSVIPVCRAARCNGLIKQFADVFSGTPAMGGLRRPPKAGPRQTSAPKALILAAATSCQAERRPWARARYTVSEAGSGCFDGAAQDTAPPSPAPARWQR